MYTQFICLRVGKCKGLHTSGFFLTCWLKPNCIFPSGQLHIILLHYQVFNSNSQHGANDNNYFTAKEREKVSHMSLLIKAIIIYAGKKVGHYC